MSKVVRCFCWLRNSPYPVNQSDAQIKAKYSEAEEVINRPNTLRASAKQKLIAGEKLTEEEADILIGV